MRKSKYSKEIHDFISKNAKGITAGELAKLTNEKFGTDFTVSKMRAYKNSHKLCSGLITRYSNEIKKFIAANVKGLSSEKLAKLTNEKFGTNFTPQKMQMYKSNHNLQSGTQYDGAKHKKYSLEIENFIRQNASGLYNKELAELVNKTFSTSYTAAQIDSFKSRHGISSGLEGFKKGNIPTNKGKKMSSEQYSKCAPTMFKKGNIPKNHQPVGTERITADGYIEIKVAEPNKWKPKAVYIWEHHGKVSKGSKVIFLDRNKRNFDIENLACVTSAELARLNKNHRISEFPEVTKAGITLEKYKKTIRGIKNDNH